MRVSLVCSFFAPILFVFDTFCPNLFLAKFSLCTCRALRGSLAETATV